MALNKEVFKTRSLTAVIFVAVMLTGMLWNLWSFSILFVIIHFGCWYEFLKLVKKIYKEKYAMYCLWGLAYITMPVMMMLHIRVGGLHRNGDIGQMIACAIIFSIWVNDTMAYIVGSLIGKTPFSKISPKKTWEGTAGGALLCVMVIALVGYLVTKQLYFWMGIAAICAVFGTAGDLLESKLKRMADVKDSGTIMPGHGGFLDRFDSMLVATPFVWLYVQLFMI